MLQFPIDVYIIVGRIMLNIGIFHAPTIKLIRIVTFYCAKERENFCSCDSILIAAPKRQQDLHYQHVYIHPT